MGMKEECIFGMKFSSELVINVEVLEICDVILVLDFDTGPLVEWPAMATISKMGKENSTLMPSLSLDLQWKVAIQSSSASKLLVFPWLYRSSER